MKNTTRSRRKAALGPLDKAALAAVAGGITHEGYRSSDLATGTSFSVADALCGGGPHV